MPYFISQKNQIITGPLLLQMSGCLMKIQTTRRRFHDLMAMRFMLLIRMFHRSIDISKRHNI